MQTGLSYWISFQSLAFIILSIFIFLNKPKVKINLRVILPIFLFIIFLIDLYFYRSFILPENISNLELSIGRIIFFGSTIYFIFFFRFKNNKLLSFIRNIYSNLLITFSSLIIISESRIIPFLSTEFLTRQNASLISNQSNLENINLTIRDIERLDNAPNLRPDLFYGEPSYLALIAFCAFSGFIFSSYIKAKNQNEKKPELSIFKTENIFFCILTIVILFLTKSLSGVLYTFIIISLFAAIRIFYQRTISYKLLAVFIITFTYLITLFSTERLLLRFNFIDSLSFYDRIKTFFQWDVSDYILGLQSSLKVPEIGFHNGFFFGIAIGGITFFIYFLSIIKRLCFLSESIPFNIYASLLFFAIFMQNGAIFTPDKSVIIALTFLPFLAKKQIN